MTLWSEQHCLYQSSSSGYNMFLIADLHLLSTCINVSIKHKLHNSTQRGLRRRWIGQKLTLTVHTLRNTKYLVKSPRNKADIHVCIQHFFKSFLDLTPLILKLSFVHHLGRSFQHANDFPYS